MWEVADGDEAVAAVAKERPDVVLMDVCMPRMNGIEATSLIRDIAPATRVIIVSMHEDQEHVSTALRAGAAGYVAKTAAADELQQALRAVRRGEVFVSPRLQPAAARERQHPLTARQLEVLRLIAAGRSSRQIADALNIRVKTVESHRMHLMRKLDVHEVAGLVRYAVRQRLIEPR